MLRNQQDRIIHYQPWLPNSLVSRPPSCILYCRSYTYMNSFILDTRKKGLTFVKSIKMSELPGVFYFVHCPYSKKTLENIKFRKLDLFRSSGERGRYLKMETDVVSETLCSLVYFSEYRTMDKSPRVR
jgi:hypothetical protein